MFKSSFSPEYRHRTRVVLLLPVVVSQSDILELFHNLLFGNTEIHFVMGLPKWLHTFGYRPDGMSSLLCPPRVSTYFGIGFLAGALITSTAF